VPIPLLKEGVEIILLAQLRAGKSDLCQSFTPITFKHQDSAIHLQMKTERLREVK
jgi:hypothetical protein